ncbi:hypothetical protein LTR70_005150 [Exophiala xenobiotica]|uniref:CCHC-type domain-containing protein n=1 Tax=Lithohypha guttulata TaxID=1690604 RepID=A0ABR0KAR2_9EURO|nr:hypothetical protein LTR24_004875 [Lithohypha guttulata]KAK5319248.1 hypothetical protein LTR70_005150 [Exophiala xenobiotica]
MARTKNRSKRKGPAVPPAGESRTAVTGNKGRKRSAALASTADSRNSQEPARKRRKHLPKDNRRQDNTVGTEDLRDFTSFSSLHNTHFATGQSSMPVQNLGNNRLRSGFHYARRIQRSASHPGTPSDSGDGSNSPAPEVYDLDTEDDDGGITLNVQGNDNAPIVISDDEGSEREDGQINESSDLEEGQERDHVQTRSRGDNMQLDTSDEMPSEAVRDVDFVVDSTSAMPQVHLKDLNPDQLENQIRYAFWHLQRDQIDLSRLARCLHCQAEGHIDEKCPQKICLHCGAFAQHYAVLCPQVKRSKTSMAPRWSLKSLDPEQIVNLSIQSGMDKLEKDAQNRGMRPEGLKIRGRANQHQADSRRRDPRNSDSDDLENFLSHPPRARNDRRHAPPVQPPQDQFHYRPGDNARYDRYAAPTGSESYRPPRNNFYATDSFGGRRSRSPQSLGRYDVHRSPSPVGSYNSYRPGHYPQSRRSPPPSRSNIPPRPPPTLPRPAPGVAIQLPTRKSSNTSIAGAASAATANLPRKPPLLADGNPMTRSRDNEPRKPRAPKKAHKK